MRKYLDINLDLKTVSESNCFEHWTVKSKRHREQKKAIWAEFKRIQPIISLPSIVKLTRTGKRLLDDDNLPSSLKWIRDAVAEEVFPGLRPGQADGKEGLTWAYAQRTGKTYAVQIEVFKLD